jgi:hypothetical protein
MEPLQYAWKADAAARVEIKSLCAINVRKRRWTRFAALSKISARRESRIPIWPALRNTFVLPNCEKKKKKKKERKKERKKKEKEQRFVLDPTQQEKKITDNWINLTKGTHVHDKLGHFEEAYLKILKLQLSQNFLCHSFVIITENTKIFLEGSGERERCKNRRNIYIHTHMMVFTRTTKYNKYIQANKTTQNLWKYKLEHQ